MPNSSMADISAVLNPLATGLSLIGGLKGLFGGRGPDPRKQYLDQLGQQLAEQQQQLVGSNRRNLYSMAGTGGDALARLGRRMGSNLAGAGVYNSSATAGNLTQAQQDLNAQIASLGNRNLQDELAQNTANQRWLTGQRLGIAQGDMGYNRQNEANSIGGFANLLQQLVGGGRAVPGGDVARNTGDARNGKQGSGVDMSTIWNPASTGNLAIGGVGNLGAGNSPPPLGGWGMYPASTTLVPRMKLNNRFGPAYGFG